ncbi:MAG: 3-isopropylmalate dehydrogenase [Spirochaetaceae bacterium]|jgi:3-isopropylmalate dehydrogenase|nr:3-isopropylmalate dehydrogenase [Spirochaetaceae bacterium]
MNYSIALVPGDGIGPEVIAPATEVLDAVGDRYGHVFNYVELEAGGAAIDSTGEPLPAATLEAATQCDALLLGAVGGPRWENLPGHLRPERALLGLRAALEVYANLRPAVLLPQLRSACPLKDEVLSASNHEGRAAFDLLIVRELTGGLYFGKRGRLEEESDGHRPGAAFDTETYSWREIERVLRRAYAAAALRRKKLCVVDKANVLESSRYWREVTAAVSGDYPEIETSFMYVDNCAMQLIRGPGQFDVIVTSNLFGDILSDEASVLTGSIGMLPSASLGDIVGGRPRGMYEPIHGSAPDIAGQDIANPLGTILSAAMMLRYSFGLEAEALAVEDAVGAVLDSGYRTRDIAARSAAGGEKIVGTQAMGKAVVELLETTRNF